MPQYFPRFKLSKPIELFTMAATTDETFMQIGPPSSDDLFGGDILGDELMDIYNAAVVGGGNDEVMNGM